MCRAEVSVLAAPMLERLMVEMGRALAAQSGDPDAPFTIGPVDFGEEKP